MKDGSKVQEKIGHLQHRGYGPGRFLSVLLLLVLLYFYARKDWESFSKRNLWMICIIDMLLAGLYHLDILLEPTDEYTAYMLTEIWIRPTITYGLVACFIQENN